MKKHLSLGLILGLLIGLLLSSTAVMATTPIKLVVNGVDITYKSDVPPQIIDGRTLVPARALAEALGAAVTWDSATNTVIVNSLKPSELKPPKNEASQDWVSARDLIDTYPAITEVFAGEELEIKGKNELLISNFYYQNINDGTYSLESNLGTLKIKKDNSRLYLSINNLKTLGVL